MKSQLSTIFYAILAFSLAVNAQVDPTPYDAATQNSTVPAYKVVGTQAAIWTSLGLIFILLMTLCIMCRMDPDRSQDTIIYAKFIGQFEKPRTA